MSHKATLAVRTGIETDQQHGAVVPPIYLSSNYTFADFGEPRPIRLCPLRQSDPYQSG